MRETLAYKLRRRVDCMALRIVQPLFYRFSDEAGDDLYLRFVRRYGVPVKCECGRHTVRWQPVVRES